MSLNAWAFDLPRHSSANRRIWLLLTCILGASFAALGQCAKHPPLPFDKPFEQPDDYRKLDAVAAKAIEWTLAATEPECAASRDRVNAFLLVWLSGHPDVVVRLEPSVFPFFTTHPDLLYTALFAMARFELNRSSQDPAPMQAHVAALEAIGQEVKANKALRRDPVFKAFKKQWRKNRLERWYTEHLK